MTPEKSLTGLPIFLPEEIVSLSIRASNTPPINLIALKILDER